MPRRLGLLLQSCGRRLRAWAGGWRDPVRRDRMKARAAFAFIALFTVASIDYLITGGPEWNPGAGEAHAMALPHSQRVSAPAPAPVIIVEAPPTLTVAHVEPDYSFTDEILLGGPEPASETAPADKLKPQPILVIKG